MSVIILLIKAYVREFKNRIFNSPKWYYRALNPLYRLCRGIILIIFDRNYRYDRLTEIRYSKQIFQPNSYTSYNRYPDLFQIVQENFIDSPELLKICSFGCSTGREVSTLLKYFPLATIVGVDINMRNLRVCRKYFLQKNTNFIHSLSKDWLQFVGFDAIFCLAVLQHTNNRDFKNRIARQFTFQQFTQQIHQFDDKLKIGGLLILDHCDFSFTDTEVYSRYLPLECENNYLQRQRPLYDSCNRRQAEVFAGFRVFQKVS